VVVHGVSCVCPCPQVIQLQSSNEHWHDAPTTSKFVMKTKTAVFKFAANGPEDEQWWLSVFAECFQAAAEAEEERKAGVPPLLQTPGSHTATAGTDPAESDRERATALAASGAGAPGVAGPTTQPPAKVATCCCVVM